MSAMAWAGSNLIVAVPGSYKLISGGVITTIVERIACHTLLAGVPAAQQALLQFDETMTLITDSQGAAIKEPLVMPGQPLALAQAGAFVVAVCGDGIHVFDRNTSREVQQIAFPYAAVAAGDGGYLQEGNSAALPVADNVAGSCVVLGTPTSVYCLQPVAMEQQVRDLLKRKQYTQVYTATVPDLMSSGCIACLRNWSVLSAKSAFTCVCVLFFVHQVHICQPC